MKQDRIDQQTSVPVQSQDPIGVLAGETTHGTKGHPLHDVAPKSSVELAWSLTH